MISGIVEVLSVIPTPNVSRKSVSRLLRDRTALELNYSDLKVSRQKRLVLNTLLDSLTRPETNEEIKRGNIALAVVRPRIDESNLPVADDDQAALLLLKKLQPELLPILAFPFVFNELTVRSFWEPKYINTPAIKYHSFPNAWEEFLYIMTRGASTIVLAHSEDGNAVPKIREKIGDWRNPEHGTIRGDLSLREASGGIAHNLIHASESPEHVKRELAIILSELEKIQ